MRIKVVSDLHLEFSDTNITNDEGCDVLILGGDILTAMDLLDHPDGSMNPLVPLGSRQKTALQFRDFLKRCSVRFPHVVYVAGNHEFYHGKWMQTLDVLADECAKYPNIYFMENDTRVIDDVVFVGATLWTDMNRSDPLTLHAVPDMINDFRLIRHDGQGYTRLRPAHTIERHRESLEYIRQALEMNADKQCVVVTHMSPSFQSCHPQYANDQLMNGSFHSELSEFILDHPQIQLWTHGHTHHCFDYMIGDTRVVCNPRGYHNGSYGEETGWDPKKVIEI